MSGLRLRKDQVRSSHSRPDMVVLSGQPRAIEAMYEAARGRKWRWVKPFPVAAWLWQGITQVRTRAGPIRTSLSLVWTSAGLMILRGFASVRSLLALPRLAQQPGSLTAQVPVKLSHSRPCASYLFHPLSSNERNRNRPEQGLHLPFAEESRPPSINVSPQ